MRQEMMGFWNNSNISWNYANNVNLMNTSLLNFYGPDALPDAQPTVSKH